MPLPLPLAAPPVTPWPPLQMTAVSALFCLDEPLIPIMMDRQRKTREACQFGAFAHRNYCRRPGPHAPCCMSQSYLAKRTGLACQSLTQRRLGQPQTGNLPKQPGVCIQSARQASLASKNQGPTGLASHTHSPHSHAFCASQAFFCPRFPEPNPCMHSLLQVTRCPHNTSGACLEATITGQTTRSGQPCNHQWHSAG